VNAPIYRAAARRSARCLAALALTLTGGCRSAGSGNTNYSQFYQIMKTSLAATMGKVRVTREQAAAVPYASLGYSIDGGNQIMLVLATDSNGELLWTSPTHVVIVTRDGRITRTLGLPHDLAAVTSPGGFPPPPAAALRGAFTTTRQADFPQLGLYGVSLSCRARLVGRQKVDILGQAITANRVEENCRSQNPDWTFTDIYWLDPDNGQPWRSRQHTNPKGGTVELEIFRPPG
jgi:hypothetical protein